LKRYRRTTMTGDEVKIAFAKLDLTVPAIAKVFGKHERTVWDWQNSGAPTHIALALEKWLAGELTAAEVKPWLRRIGRTRDDGTRYRAR